MKSIHVQIPRRSSVKLTAKQRSYYAGSGLILPPHGTGPPPVLGEKGATALSARLFPLNNTTTTGLHNLPSSATFHAIPHFLTSDLAHDWH